MEIEKLHKMLTDAGIEHEWRDRTPEGWERFKGRFTNVAVTWGYQIIVYRENGERLISAIEGFGTHGYIPENEMLPPSDLIEIMGCLTPEEEKYDSVCGWLTAEEVFRRIQEALCLK